MLSVRPPVSLELDPEGQAASNGGDGVRGGHSRWKDWNEQNTSLQESMRSGESFRLIEMQANMRERCRLSRQVREQGGAS